MLTDFGSEHSFRRSCQRLKEHYGFELNATAVRDITLQHAQRASCRLEARYEQDFRALPKSGAVQLVAQADGTMICTVEAQRRRRGPRPRQWKEMRLMASQQQGSVESIYAATFGSVEEAGRRWAHSARQAGWALESSIHVVADGAEWIERQSKEVFGNQATLLVDFYHLSQYLAAAAQSCRPRAPQQWLRIQQKRLKRGTKTKVLQAMEPYVEVHSVPDEQAPVRNALRYMTNRLTALDYPKAIARELPIGSGLIESGHKHVLHARLKQPGSAWLPAHAHSLAQLRVLRANNEWNGLWIDPLNT